MRCGGQQFRTKTATDGGKNPVWNETFSYNVVGGFEGPHRNRQLGGDPALWPPCKGMATLMSIRLL